MSLTRHGLPSSDKSIDFTCVDIGCGGINQVPGARGLQCSMSVETKNRPGDFF